MGSESPCLVDAEVVVDGFRYGYFDAMVTGHAIALSGWVRSSVEFYVTDGGEQVLIDLCTYVTTGKVHVEGATLMELTSVIEATDSFQLSMGEIESLALVVARGYCYCTSDQASVRAMDELGILDRWVPLLSLAPAAARYVLPGDLARNAKGNRVAS